MKKFLLVLPFVWTCKQDVDRHLPQKIPETIYIPEEPKVPLRLYLLPNLYSFFKNLIACT